MSLATGLTLLRAVISTLRRHRIPHALGGAAALAVYGVSRSTVALDLLTTDRRVLVADTWTALTEEKILVDVRTGDEDDPLAGVVRFSQPDARPVDLVVGRLAWQKAAIDRAEHHQMGEMEVAVLSASDLILMKLYAGGPQDAWDIHQLLASDRSLITEVENGLPFLGDEARALWSEIKEKMR